MSHGGVIQLVIASILGLMQALKDLNMAYETKRQIESANGDFVNVDIVVKDENNRSIGFQKQKDGRYKVIADSKGLTSAQLKKQQQFINRIKQRYAYNMIVGELKKQGYQVTEEKKVEKDLVKLVARRWVG